LISLTFVVYVTRGMKNEKDLAQILTVKFLSKIELEYNNNHETMKIVNQSSMAHGKE